MKTKKVTLKEPAAKVAPVEQPAAEIDRRIEQMIRVNRRFAGGTEKAAKFAIGAVSGTVDAALKTVQRLLTPSTPRHTT